MAEKHSDKTPQHEINALARCLLPKIQKFFASPEGQKEFEEWKAQRAKEAEQHKSVQQKRRYRYDTAAFALA